MTRNVGLDFVRTLGLVAVVVGHVWYVPAVARWTYSWHVPLFFLLAGYLWTGDRTLAQEGHRRWSSIVRPYAVWWCVVLVSYVGYCAVTDDHVDLKRILLAAWGGVGAYRPWSAFWFFSAFLVAVVVVRACDKWWAMAIGLLALAACTIFEDPLWRAPLAIPAGLACVVFVMAGRFLRAVRPGVQVPGPVGLLLLAGGFAATFIPGYEPLEIKEADFGTPGLSVAVALLIGTGLVLVAETVGPHLPAGMVRVCASIAACATGVFLSHGIFLTWLNTPVEGRWLDFAVVLLVPLSASLLLLRSRFAPWFLGRPRIVKGNGAQVTFAQPND